MVESAPEIGAEEEHEPEEEEEEGTHAPAKLASGGALAAALPLLGLKGCVPTDTSNRFEINLGQQTVGGGSIVWDLSIGMCVVLFKRACVRSPSLCIVLDILLLCIF